MSSISREPSAMFDPRYTRPHDENTFEQDGHWYRLEYTCGRQLRSKRRCTKDKGHRGRCCSVTFYCDHCGKARESVPVAYGYEGEKYCFMCVHVLYPYPQEYY
jgi:hypothetical protein